MSTMATSPYLTTRPLRPWHDVWLSRLAAELAEWEARSGD